jgi:predicted O-methyltransferase YrrM
MMLLTMACLAYEPGMPWLQQLDGGHVGLLRDAGVQDAAIVDSVWQCKRLIEANMNWTSFGSDWKNALTLPTRYHEHSQLWRSIRGQLQGRLSKTSKVSGPDMMLLFLVVHSLQPQVSGETGFASGSSAVAIMSALPQNATHIAMDPFQPAYATDGLRSVASLAKMAADSPRFVHVNETAALALAWLGKQRQCFDFFFMDDGHKLDDNIIELKLVSQLLAIGGVLLLHDLWMPSVQKTISFIRTNLQDSLQLIPNGISGNIQIVVKKAPDLRKWNHYHNF